MTAAGLQPYWTGNFVEKELSKVLLIYFREILLREHNCLFRWLCFFVSDNFLVETNFGGLVEFIFSPEIDFCLWTFFATKKNELFLYSCFSNYQKYSKRYSEF